MTVCYWLLLLQLALLSPSVYTFSRIVGGSNVPIDQCAYQLSLRLNGRPICGATLISRDTGLTAAHCIPKRGSYSVRAGSSNLYEGGVIVYVKLAIKHPGYNANSMDYDIAIIKFYRPLRYYFRYSTKVKPVRLPELDEELLPPEAGLVSGWGMLSANYPFLSEELKGVTLPLLPTAICNRSYTFISRITPRMFCAGFEEGGKDACQGDSGGPFVANNTLYGIVSWGISCAQAGYPGVYTKVSAFRDYIKLNTRL